MQHKYCISWSCCQTVSDNVWCDVRWLLRRWWTVAV